MSQSGPPGDWGHAESSRSDLPATGHPRVDEAVAALAAAQDATPADQVGPLAGAHRTLRETLDTIGDV